MSDITVKKYQHYFAESVRLQSLVNEQAAYIEELEAALLELTEGSLSARKLERKAKALGKMGDSPEAQKLDAKLAAAGKEYAKKMRRREMREPDEDRAEAIWQQKYKTTSKITKPLHHGRDVSDIISH